MFDTVHELKVALQTAGGQCREGTAIWAYFLPPTKLLLIVHIYISSNVAAYNLQNPFQTTTKKKHVAE